MSRDDPATEITPAIILWPERCSSDAALPGIFELQDDGRQPRCLDLVLGPHGNSAQGSRPFIAVFLKPQSDSA
jgi:hypothetical protein